MSEYTEGTATVYYDTEMVDDAVHVQIVPPADDANDNLSIAICIGPQAGANAARITATWNACHGIPTATLTPGIVAELVAACEAALELIVEATPHHRGKTVQTLRAVLAKIRGA